MSLSSRVAIIGAGNVGATAAYALMLRGLFAEIVLIDRSADRAVAEATDIADANAIARPARIWAGDYADVKSADVRWRRWRNRPTRCGKCWRGSTSPVDGRGDSRLTSGSRSGQTSAR